jgi:hypothetical protein
MEIQTEEEYNKWLESEKHNLKIQVQICDWCNKPHSGRSRVEDRCVCDGSGHYHWGEIEEEYIPTNTMKGLYKGKEITEMTKEELIEALVVMGNLYTNEK